MAGVPYDALMSTSSKRCRHSGTAHIAETDTMVRITRHDTVNQHHTVDLIHKVAQLPRDG
ncbi:hypothetical protein KCP77_10650 [Salmonella enterica subsp. enterica]|nr:hypothetical protein KCP77_10650 [Salmonella enterica subsp. enterica]